MSQTNSSVPQFNSLVSQTNNSTPQNNSSFSQSNSPAMSSVHQFNSYSVSPGAMAANYPSITPENVSASQAHPVSNLSLIPDNSSRPPEEAAEKKRTLPAENASSQPRKKSRKKSCQPRKKSGHTRSQPRNISGQSRNKSESKSAQPAENKSAQPEDKSIQSHSKSVTPEKDSFPVRRETLPAAEPLSVEQGLLCAESELVPLVNPVENGEEDSDSLPVDNEEGTGSLPEEQRLLCAGSELVPQVNPESNEPGSQLLPEDSKFLPVGKESLSADKVAVNSQQDSEINTPALYVEMLPDENVSVNQVAGNKTVIEIKTASSPVSVELLLPQESMLVGQVAGNGHQQDIATAYLLSRENVSVDQGAGIAPIQQHSETASSPVEAKLSVNVEAGNLAIQQGSETAPSRVEVKMLPDESVSLHEGGAGDETIQQQDDATASMLPQVIVVSVNNHGAGIDYIRQHNQTAPSTVDVIMLPDESVSVGEGGAGDEVIGQASEVKTAPSHVDIEMIPQENASGNVTAHQQECVITLVLPQENVLAGQGARNETIHQSENEIKFAPPPDPVDVEMIPQEMSRGAAIETVHQESSKTAPMLLQESLSLLATVSVHLEDSTSENASMVPVSVIQGTENKTVFQEGIETALPPISVEVEMLPQEKNRGAAIETVHQESSKTAPMLLQESISVLATVSAHQEDSTSENASLVPQEILSVNQRTENEAIHQESSKTTAVLPRENMSVAAIESAHQEDSTSENAPMVPQEIVSVSQGTGNVTIHQEEMCETDPCPMDVEVLSQKNNNLSGSSSLSFSDVPFVSPGNNITEYKIGWASELVSHFFMSV